MAYERMLDKEQQPGQEDLARTMGQLITECWTSLAQFLETTYDVRPVLKFGGKKYGWAFSFRKGGRPLCDLFPESGAFTALIVLGGKESAEALACVETFGENIRAVVENTPAYHDGRWLWIRVRTPRDLEDIERLLLIKRKPAQRKAKA